MTGQAERGNRLDWLNTREDQ